MYIISASSIVLLMFSGLSVKINIDRLIHSIFIMHIVFENCAVAESMNLAYLCVPTWLSGETHGYTSQTPHHLTRCTSLGVANV
jgi:hypothetical protein